MKESQTEIAPLNLGEISEMVEFREIEPVVELVGTVRERSQSKRWFRGYNP